jgi:hypothetical protein
LPEFVLVTGPSTDHYHSDFRGFRGGDGFSKTGFGVGPAVTTFGVGYLGGGVGEGGFDTGERGDAAFGGAFDDVVSIAVRILVMHAWQLWEWM